MKALGVASKANVERAFLEHLEKAAGRTAADRWLEATISDIGVRSSVDIRETFYEEGDRRSLQRQALRPVYKSPYRVTTDSDHRKPIAPNVLDRRFDGWPINRAWVADITYGTPSQRSPPGWGRSCLSMSGMHAREVDVAVTSMPFFCYEKE